MIWDETEMKEYQKEYLRNLYGDDSDIPKSKTETNYKCYYAKKIIVNAMRMLKKYMM